MNSGSERFKKIKEIKDLGVVVCVKASLDGLKLVIDCTKLEEAKDVKIDCSTLQYILKQVVDQKLKYSTLQSIADLVNSKGSVESKTILRGIQPEPGEDGILKILVRQVTQRQDGSVKSNNIRDLQNVPVGTMIGKLTPPTEGKPGVDVFGKPIPSKRGKEFKVSSDKSIDFREIANGIKLLIAKHSGYLADNRGRLSIIPEMAISGDIDAIAGKVEFIGNVHISGDVSKGTLLKCRKNICVKGAAHGGTLRSSCGSIEVKGFLNGGPQYKISASGSLTANMVQNLNATIKGDILFAKDARDSKLKTFGKVVMSNGHLFGGRTKSLYGVEAKTIGSSGGSRTLIFGISDTELQAEIDKTQERLLELDETQQKINTGIAPFLDKTVALPEIGNIQILKVNQLILQLDDLESEKIVLSDRLKLLTEEIGRATFRINYLKTLHKGVIIRVGEEEYLAENDLIGPGTLEYNSATQKFSVGKLKTLGGKLDKKVTAANETQEESVGENSPEPLQEPSDLTKVSAPA